MHALAHLHLFLERTLAIIVIFDLLLEMLLMFSDNSNFVLSDNLSSKALLYVTLHSIQSMQVLISGIDFIQSKLP